ncbi:hypothetical protein [Methylocella sp.]|jgi:hypothetical protein|uniref:hypothetical protein n=1 Tax=Methylocella sp. TaxID=1978226 RepID=UPI003C18E8E8
MAVNKSGILINWFTDVHICGSKAAEMRICPAVAKTNARLHFFLGRAHHLDPPPKRPAGAGRNNLMHHPAHVGQKAPSAVIVQDNTGGAVSVSR